MRKQSVWNIVFTVWFSESISFSIFTSFGTISGNFVIFSLFSWFHGLNHVKLEFLRVKYTSGVENYLCRWINHEIQGS